MHRAGKIVLSVWFGANLLLALGILAAMLLFGANAPGLSVLLSDAQIAALDPLVRRTVSSIAVLGNASIAGFCSLGLAAVWLGPGERGEPRARRSYWVLAATALAVQCSGFASDAYVGNKNVIANVVSSVILLAGLGLVRIEATRSAG